MFKGQLAGKRPSGWTWLRLFAIVVLPAAAPFDEKGAAGSDAPRPA